MTLRKGCLAFTAIVTTLLGGAICYDLFLWKETRHRIDAISSVGGSTVAEAIHFLELNQTDLGIESVDRFEARGEEWLIVRLRKVSTIGTLLSACCNSEWIWSIEISGLVRLSIEDGRIVSSHIVF